MHPILRTALTALCVIALAWPLLFWGKPALPDLRDRDFANRQPTMYNPMDRNQLLW
jgi:hypothetical protein